ncbi:MAG: hypothetical protein MUF38_19245 [Anaerolineae bacterium]|jgi:hypothetical protein|nr:hypothetical protein [Anaerolineae bacterium]
MEEKLTPVSLRVDLDEMPREQAELVAGLLVTALCDRVGFSMDKVPKVYPKRYGRGWLVYVDGEMDSPSVKQE